jgi:hypothetical protein
MKKLEGSLLPRMRVHLGLRLAGDQQATVVASAGIDSKAQKETASLVCPLRGPEMLLKETSKALDGDFAGWTWLLA